MAKQTLVWTALPNGVRGGRLHLSVLVSPRLEVAEGESATLQTFPDWHDWAGKDVAFTVVIGGVEHAAKLEGAQRRSDLWRRLFPPDRIPVGQPTGAEVAALADELRVRSVPTGAIQKFVRTEYAALAAHYATEPPRVADLRPPIPGGSFTNRRQRGFRQALDESDYFPRLDKVTPWHELKDEVVTEIRKRLESGYFLGGPIVISGGGGGGGGDADVEGIEISAEEVGFLLAEQFQHRRLSDNVEQPRGAADEDPDPVPCGPDPTESPSKNGGPAVPAKPKANAEDPRLDFHQALGALAEYPNLLRLLGLVQDISVPVPSVPPVGEVDVHVVPTWTYTGPDPNVSMTTKCAITATTFAAIPDEDSPIKDGLLQLQGDDFDLVEIDAEAAAGGLVGYTLSLDGSITDDDDELTRTGHKPEPAPPLQSRGLSLNQGARAKSFHDAIKRNAALEESLRTNTLAEEGGLTADRLTRGVRLDVWDDQSKKWRSLCQRSGVYRFADDVDVPTAVGEEATIVTGHTEQEGDSTKYLHESLARWTGYSMAATRPGKAPSDSGQLVGTESDAGEIFDLKAVLRATPGTLPKLRFGRTYRMRARVVDLAGNSLRLDDVPADSPATTRPVTYRRFDPVATPLVLLRSPRTEGETPQTLIIRGNYDERSREQTERHLVPDKTALTLAEQHGKFDVHPNPLEPGGMSKAAYLTIKQKEPGTFAASGKPDPRQPDQRYYDTNVLQLPYLPDVLSRGVAFLGLPGVPEGEVYTEDFTEDLLNRWPNVRPFRLSVVEGTAAPKFHALGRVLEVQVPRGRTFEVRYSSHIDTDDLDVLGQWGWLVDYLADPTNPRPDGVTIDKLRPLAAKGQLWQITPYRTLTLVNAVRQPMIPPAFTKPVAVRKIGETSAKIIDKVHTDHHSTSRLDLVATWTEQVDSPDEPGPKARAGSTLAFKIDVDTSKDGADLIPISDRQEFHDTKHRHIQYELIGTSRYVDFFTERKTIKLAKGAPTIVSDKGIVPGTDAVLGTDAARTPYRRGSDYNVDYSRGTMTALVDALHDVSIEAVFVAPPVTRSSTEAAPAAEVVVPSSARPIAPDIAYIVPTFGWERSGDGATVTSTRHGNGLRVYLRRPWYSSGDGEQLGVVLSTKNEQPSERLSQYVSTWGQDPAFASAKTSATPLTGDFPAAIRPKAKLKLAEADRDASLTDTVSVAPHEVGYDEDRQLYYSDILFRPGQSYTPFIRLALARFQRDSLTDVELSSVVLAQFAQLSPDRALTAVVDSSDATLVKLTVSGLTYAPADGFARPSTVDVRVQRKLDPALEGDLAWTTVSETTLTGSSPAGTWTGAVRLPAARGSEPFRLVVREIENPPESKAGGKRLVYVDTVSL